MNFNSMFFIWAFLPTVIAVNFLLTIIKFKSPRTRTFCKNIFLLVASLVFYAWGGLPYLSIVVISILINYFGTYIMDKRTHTQGARRAVMIVTVVLDIALLSFFKYFNMVVAAVETLMHPENGGLAIVRDLLSAKGTGELGLMAIALPVGISFFTFMSISYVVDVYRGKAKCNENIIDFALYVALFPKLVFGPIVQYSEIENDLYIRQESLELFAKGQRRFFYGLAKKVIIADVLAAIANDIWKLDTATIGSAVAWLGLGAYTLQIYYDFAGCSDMAIGLGNMLGFRFKENFNYPYTSLSVQEFWRRWHISLSDWFQQYIYFPLGGSRAGKFRTYFNIFIVYLVTGIWHGENFRFLVWGLMYAVLQIIERLFLRKWLDKNPVKILNWLYTMLAVMVGWVFFRSADIFQAGEFLKQLFTFAPSSAGISIMSYLSMKRIIVYIAAILLCGFVQRPLKKVYEKISDKLPVMTLEYIWQIVLFVYAVCSIAIDGGSPALYGGF